jgi:glutathione S-transferase
MAVQLGQSEKITLHYFMIKGAIGTATICLEQGGIEYEAKAYTMEDWAAFKPKTLTGQLPCLEYEDGTMIAESGAVSRVAAAKAGLLGEGRDFAKSEMLLGMTVDLWKLVAGNVPTIITVGNWTAEKDKAWTDEHRPKVKTSVERYVKLLVGDSARFTNRGDTLGELDLWYRLSQLVNGAWPDLLTEVPGLKAFYERVAELQGPKKFYTDQTKFGALPAYFVPMP